MEALLIEILYVNDKSDSWSRKSYSKDGQCAKVDPKSSTQRERDTSEHELNFQSFLSTSADVSGLHTLYSHSSTQTAPHDPDSAKINSPALVLAVHPDNGGTGRILETFQSDDLRSPPHETILKAHKL